jgi:hypothetical protein
MYNLHGISEAVTEDDVKWMAQKELEHQAIVDSYDAEKVMENRFADRWDQLASEYGFKRWPKEVASVIEQIPDRIRAGYEFEEYPKYYKGIGEDKAYELLQSVSFISRDTFKALVECWDGMGWDNKDRAKSGRKAYLPSS